MYDSIRVRGAVGISEKRNDEIFQRWRHARRKIRGDAEVCNYSERKYQVVKGSPGGSLGCEQVWGRFFSIPDRLWVQKVQTYLPSATLSQTHYQESWWHVVLLGSTFDLLLMMCDVWLPPDDKVARRQCFSHVCLSFCPQGWGVSLYRVLAPVSSPQNLLFRALALTPFL